MKNFSIPSPRLCFLLVGSALISVTTVVSARELRPIDVTTGRTEVLQERLEEADLESPDAIRNTTRTLIQEITAGGTVNPGMSLGTAGDAVAEGLEATSAFVISGILEATGGTAEAAEAASAGAIEAALSIDDDNPTVFPNLVGKIRPESLAMVKNAASGSMTAVAATAQSAELETEATEQLLEASSRASVDTAIEESGFQGASAASFANAAAQGAVKGYVNPISLFNRETRRVERAHSLSEGGSISLKDGRYLSAVARGSVEGALGFGKMDPPEVANGRNFSSEDRLELLRETARGSMHGAIEAASVRPFNRTQEVKLAAFATARGIATETVKGSPLAGLDNLAAIEAAGSGMGEGIENGADLIGIAGSVSEVPFKNLIRSAEAGIAEGVDPAGSGRGREVSNYFDQTVRQGAVDAGVARDVVIELGAETEETVEVEDLENLEEEEVTDPVTDEDYFSP
jgi:hypothetical protein